MFFLCRATDAQITMIQEKHHKVVLENQWIRITELVISVGDTVAAHRHDKASVVIFLTASKCAIQDIGQQPAVANVAPGNTVYRAYDEKPVTHLVWSADESFFRCLVVEMMKPHRGESCPPPAKNGLALLWRQKAVSAYGLEVLTGSSFNLPASNCQFVLIDFSGSATARGQKLGVGDFLFIPSDHATKITAAEKENAKCVLLQLTPMR